MRGFRAGLSLGLIPFQVAAQALGVISGMTENLPGGAAPLPDVFQTETAQFEYPECDEARQAYRENFTHVTELPPWVAESQTDIHSMGEKHSLQRRMMKVGSEYQFHRRQPIGDDFDLDPMISFAVGLDAGDNANESSYRASHKTLRELSTLMLLDISGSTQDTNAKGVSISIGTDKSDERLVKVEELSWAAKRYAYGVSSSAPVSPIDSINPTPKIPQHQATLGH